MSEFRQLLGNVLSRYKGGPGSGHHGHVGRPGHWGGSLPGGRTAETLRAGLVDYGLGTDSPEYSRAVDIASSIVGYIDDHSRRYRNPDMPLGDAIEEAIESTPEHWKAEPYGIGYSVHGDPIPFRLLEAMRNAEFREYIELLTAHEPMPWWRTGD